MPLPDPCLTCAPFGGNYRLVVKGDSEGLGRCDCLRGQALASMDSQRSLPPLREVEPRISVEAATTGVSMLTALKWFPTEPAARVLIADELRSICNDEDEMIWTCKRMVRLFSEWPGVPTLRAVFCSKYFPLDRSASPAICEEFPEGIPAEVAASPVRLALPPGHIATADPTLDVAIQQAAEILDLNNRLAASRAPARVSEISANSEYSPITQSDIDVAVEKVRGERSREILPE